MDRHYLYVFSERRVYCIFSIFLGSNQRYHVTSLFANVPQNEGIEIGLRSVSKFLQSNPPSPTHYMREMLGLILVPVQWKALPTNPPYRDGHKDSSFLCISANMFTKLNRLLTRHRNFLRRSKLTSSYY